MDRNLFGLSLAMLVCGCGGTPVQNGDGSGTQDLGAQSADMAGGAKGVVGDPCVLSSDCGDGAFPVCWAKRVLNRDQNEVLPGGYCTRKCMADADCGANGRCQDFDFEGRWCLRKCSGPADCRKPGFECRTFYPSTSHYAACISAIPHGCDPTAGDGTCIIDVNGVMLRGGCMRRALGAGNTGDCALPCALGVGSCGMGAHCFAIDQKIDFVTGMATGDKFTGALCALFSSELTEGMPCDPPSPVEPPRVYGCADGLQCTIAIPNLAPNGDGKCHTLCYLPNGGAPDGGVAPACGNGLTCTDLYKVGNAADPSARIGFCL